MGRVRALSENVRAHASVLVVVVLWAGSFPAIKSLLDHGVRAEDIAILRYALAVPGFAYILWRVRGLPGLTRADAARVVAAGVLIVLGYHLFLNIGTKSTTAGIAALVVALAPGMTLVIAALVGLERLSAARIAGLAVAFGGVAVVVTLGSGQEVSFSSAKGPLIVLGAPLAFALYNVILKPLLGRHDLLAMTAATSLVGTVGLVPLVRGSTVDALTSSAGELALLLYLGLAATLFGYIAWNHGLRGLGATRAVTYTYAISPLAVTIAALTIGEEITVWLVVGAVLVVTGIAVAQRSGAPSSLRRLVFARSRPV